MMRLIFTLLLIVCGQTVRSGDPVRDYSAMVGFLSEYLQIKYQQYQFDEFLYVAVKQQKMFYIRNKNVIEVFSVSTAKNGIGGGWGSHCTPPGLHEIKEKVGEGVPVGGVIKEKVYTGRVSEIIGTPQSTGTDEITTRLLHLSGLEPGVNKEHKNDSYLRGIMIHGTPEEGLLGQPVSHGCVRMKNDDIVRLYGQINTGTLVVILNN